MNELAFFLRDKTMAYYSLPAGVRQALILVAVTSTAAPTSTSTSTSTLPISWTLPRSRSGSRASSGSSGRT
ncbi:hypothetical protein [Saltwater crocodilepox virus]|nr:hypothetical protein [Saltwater crocodilepox virus]AVD69373.1 hypothetical protein [Saltwater crocodilepox virus]QGT46475.1 ORF036 [Saltwater crocodilepox virus]QGT46691.1 ORF036 [Saltwater crocodilepox virus]QGT46908.1 ORF036 [Saltwater crocodilepox virus]